MAEVVSAAAAIGALPEVLSGQLRRHDTLMDAQALNLARAELLKVHRSLLETLMRIPPRYQGKGLDTLIGYEGEKDQVKLALALAGSVFLTGNPGTGKTHMAVGLMWQWLSDSLRVEFRRDGGMIAWGVNFKAGDPLHVPVFVSVPEFYGELKDTFDGKGEDSERTVMNRYSTAILLVLDDIGAEQITDWKRGVLYSLIDRRYREMKQTIITSNMTLDDIASRIDDRIASRIVEMGAVIAMAGEDYRLKARTA